MAGVAVIWLVIIGTSIWVAIDASNIGARRGLIKGLGNMGPAGWFFCCLLIWIIGFPVYLAKRSEIKAAADSTKAPIPTLTQYPPPAAGYANRPAQGQPGLQEGVTSKADELTKLDELRRSGVLSEEEFASQKVKLLS
jgi:hypothetical protein